MSLEISNDDYYRAFLISKDVDLELHLKREPNSCCVNNYFSVGFKVWQTNIVIQPGFDEYKAVTYMCQYWSKAEDQCSHAMKQAAFENNRHHHDMKTTAKVYLANRVYHILSELKLRRIFLVVYLVTQIFMTKEFKYHFQKNNSANFQAIAFIFSIDHISIVISKDQVHVHHFGMEDIVF